MKKNVITKKDIVNDMSENLRKTKKEIDEIVQIFLDTISEKVSQDNKVNISGFGTFESILRAARNGINPLTKEPIQIEAKTSIKFKVAKAFKEKLQ